jgi:hypothetical protein
MKLSKRRKKNLERLMELTIYFDSRVGFSQNHEKCGVVFKSRSRFTALLDDINICAARILN